jgi:hypothetical protein
VLVSDILRIASEGSSVKHSLQFINQPFSSQV